MRVALNIVPDRAMPTNPESKAYIVFLIFPILILMCEIIALSVAQSAVEHHRLDTHGITTNGTAILARIEPAGRSGGCWVVYYIFHYNGVRYNGDDKTTRTWVKATRLPTTIQVRFLPDNPVVNWPPDVGVRTPMPVKILFVVLGLVGFVYLTVRVFSAWHRSGNRWSKLAMALIVLSWVFTALCGFDFVPLLTVMLAMGCVTVAAGFALAQRAPGIQPGIRVTPAG